MRRDDFERHKQRSAREDRERYTVHRRRRDDQRWIDFVAVIGLIVGTIALALIVVLALLAINDWLFWRVVTEEDW
jgi:H+/Cl- antiporter ClcA